MGSHVESLDVPSEFICPLSGDLMRDPVIVASGVSYERAFIEDWFASGRTFCPKSDEELEHTDLFPNVALKTLISEWCARHGIPLSPELDPIPRSLKMDPGWQGNVNSMDGLWGEEEEDVRSGGGHHAVGQSEDRHAHAPGRGLRTVHRPSASWDTPNHSRNSSSVSGSSTPGAARRDPGQQWFTTRPSSWGGDVDDGGPGRGSGRSAGRGSSQRQRHPYRHNGAGSPGERDRMHSSNGSNSGPDAPPPAPLPRKPGASRGAPRQDDGYHRPMIPPSLASPRSHPHGQGSTRDLPRLAAARPAGGPPSQALPSGAGRRDLSPRRDGRPVASRSFEPGDQAARRPPASNSYAGDTGPSVSRLPEKEGFEGYSEEFEGMERTEGGVGWAVGLLERGSSLEVAEALSYLRGALRDGTDVPAELLDWGGVPLVVDAMESKDRAVAEDAAALVLSLCQSWEGRRQVVEADGVAALVDVLVAGPDSAQSSAAASLFTLASAHDEHKQNIRVSGGIRPLIRLLQSQSLRTRKDAALALFALSYDHRCAEEIVHEGAVGVLVDMLSDKRPGVEEKAMSVLANLARHPEGQDALLGVEGGVVVVLDVLESDSPRAREEALLALHHLVSENVLTAAALNSDGALFPVAKMAQMRDSPPEAMELYRILLAAKKGGGSNGTGNGFS